MYLEFPLELLMCNNFSQAAFNIFFAHNIILFNTTFSINLLIWLWKFSLWMTFSCVSRPTQTKLSTLCQKLCSNYPQVTPTQNRCLTRFALSLSLWYSLSSAVAGLVAVGFFLATPDGIDQNANEHRPWKLTASTKRCTEGEWKTKANENLQKKNEYQKSLQRGNNTNFAIICNITKNC